MLTYILTATPILVIGLLMASGRASSIGAGLVGASLAEIIAMTAAPTVLTPGMALAAAAKGPCLSWLVGLVILSGLFFREVVSGDDAATGKTNRRRRVFAACLLIGPFTESANGFGVGQVATVVLLRGLAVPPLHMALLALFSQILVPWGAMANGTLVGAHLAGVSAKRPLLFAWLLVFWRFCAAAGVDSKSTDLASEFAWVAVMAALLIVANILFGPEVAAMAALGPLG
jgi:lactate permease